MQNLMQNLDKALFLKNQTFCLKNWKRWRAPTKIEVDNFCWNFAHVSFLSISTKVSSGFFFNFVFRSWVICQS